MNFLAHLHLSGSNNEIRIGNFIADFIKGKNYEQYPLDIQKGITLHRHIDYFTDNHPTVTISKRRLYSNYHKYAAVIVDIYYDHFLAKHWSTFSPIPLEEFAEDFYLSIQDYANIPDEVKSFLPKMIANNWLVNYSKIEGVERALIGMSKRAKFVSGMEKSIKDLKEDFVAFENDFLNFYPDLLKFSREFLTHT